MNSIKILLAVFVVLALLTGGYFLMEQRSERTLAGESDFSIADTEQVYRMFMADRQGNRVDLKREGTQWRYNEKYIARANAVENVLETLRRVDVRFKPAKALEENMIIDLASNGIHVQVMDKQGRILKDFYVGGVTNDETGTYMMMEGSGQPYVTHMKGMEGGLRARFPMRELDWRDRTVWNLAADDIDWVTVEYPKQKNKSFKLTRSADGLEIAPFYEITPRINQPINAGKAKGYLSGFSNLIAESFENNSPLRDSVSRLVPFSIITVAQVDGAQQSIRLHPYGYGDIYDESGKPVATLNNSSNIERYLADVSTGDFMMVQHNIFKRVLWGYDFFF